MSKAKKSKATKIKAQTIADFVGNTIRFMGLANQRGRIGNMLDTNRNTALVETSPEDVHELAQALINATGGRGDVDQMTERLLERREDLLVERADEAEADKNRPPTESASVKYRRPRAPRHVPSSVLVDHCWEA